MYVNPFLAGVLTTLFVELTVLFVAIVHYNWRKKK